jgi:hypothetical protein
MFRAATDHWLITVIENKPENWELPADIPLEDPHFYQQSARDMLIGATVFFEVLRPEKQCRQDHPTLKNTQYVWVLSGCILPNSVDQQKTATTSLLTTTHDMQAQVERFWLQEELMTRHFTHSVTRHDAGRFRVRLLLRQEVGELCDSLATATQNFGHMERRVLKNLELKNDYVKLMNDYQRRAHKTRQTY